MATITEIARNVGVGRSTVSYVLRGKAREARVSEKTASQILAAAERLNFMPNSAARATRTGRFHTVGLLMSTDGSRSLQSFGMLRAITEALQRHDLKLILCEFPDRELNNDEFAPRMLRELAADGLLVNYTHQMPPRMRELMRRHRIPAVWINAKLENDCVYLDDHDAGRRLTEHLLGLGHRKIAAIYFGRSMHYSVRDRLAGYEQAMNDAGLLPRTFAPPDATQWPTDDREAALQRAALAREILADRDRPSAVICYGPAEAMPLLYAAQAAGLQIGSDLSIAAFSDRPILEPGIPVTTMWFSLGEAGRSAVNMLAEKIEAPDKPLAAMSQKAILDPGCTCGPVEDNPA
jgi:LacI family transcriptional regulator